MWMCMQALRHSGTEADVKDMLKLADSMREIFNEQPELASELIRNGDSKPDAKLDKVELATWTIVANTLMNRDDFISK